MLNTYNIAFQYQNLNISDNNKYFTDCLNKEKEISMLILSQIYFQICTEIDLKSLSLYAWLTIAGRSLFLFLVL